MPASFSFQTPKTPPPPAQVATAARTNKAPSYPLQLFPYSSSAGDEKRFVDALIHSIYVIPWVRPMGGPLQQSRESIL